MRCDYNTSSKSCCSAAWSATYSSIQIRDAEAFQQCCDTFFLCTTYTFYRKFVHGSYSRPFDSWKITGLRIWKMHKNWWNLCKIEIESGENKEECLQTCHTFDSYHAAGSFGKLGSDSSISGLILPIICDVSKKRTNFCDRLWVTPWNANEKPKTQNKHSSIIRIYINIGFCVHIQVFWIYT